ncbi:matrixin family metalloprotease [Convivina intestini]|uniref:Matrixin n=1 Tax=Convivina intestini TaxID=1505726 RepID=A0A2U1D4J8_9LACO|nr:M57 family metalloprotease [Convivina intestini]PVY82570.1 matrixin [Convivina intestini]CAH1857283.1 hypothetical protein R077811_01465 [Convivina intestini]SDC10138.1 Matrixin [Leuconostocaceae bacterium R-53105]
MKKLFKLIVLVATLFLGWTWYQNHPAQSQAVFTQLNSYVMTVKDNIDRAIAQHQQATTAATNTNAPDQTPIESIVQGTNLANTYYYTYEDNIPAAAQRVFDNAVQVYNQTGLVHLVAGTGNNQQNTIKFGVYHKQIDNLGQNSVELGLGGPEIIKETSIIGTTSINHGTANLNATYQQAFTNSVAIHELGHALGLDHSQSRLSVMYPYDQGLTQLSTGDIEALKSIYAKG